MPLLGVLGGYCPDSRFKARVIKSDGTLAGEGERGQLFVTGPSVASYYLGNPAAYVYLTFSWLRLTAT